MALKVMEHPNIINICILKWWEEEWKHVYPRAKCLLILADDGVEGVMV